MGVQLGGFGEVLRYWPFLLDGLRWTVQISLIAMAGGLLIGMLVALARVYQVPVLSTVGALYVDFFRSTPVLAQLIWIYYALPILTGKSLTAITAGSIGLSLYAGSFLSEVFRAGLLSVERGQTEAALALGMTRLQSLRRVVLPQAIVRMLPPIGSSLVTLVKDSSLLTVIAVPELMRQSETLASITFRRMEVLTVIAFVYFLMTYPISRGVDYLHHRLGTDS